MKKYDMNSACIILFWMIFWYSMPSFSLALTFFSSLPALSSQSHGMQLDYAGSCLKPARFGKKKRSSASISSDSTEVSLPPPPREKAFESLHERILKKVIEKDTGMFLRLWLTIFHTGVSPLSVCF